MDGKTSRPLVAELPARTRHARALVALPEPVGLRQVAAGRASATPPPALTSAAGQDAHQDALEAVSLELRHPGPDDHLVAPVGTYPPECGEGSHEDEDAVGAERVAVVAPRALQEEAMLNVAGVVRASVRWCQAAGVVQRGEVPDAGRAGSGRCGRLGVQLVPCTSPTVSTCHVTVSKHAPVPRRVGGGAVTGTSRRPVPVP